MISPKAAFEKNGTICLYLWVILYISYNIVAMLTESVNRRPAFFYENLRQTKYFHIYILKKVFE